MICVKMNCVNYDNFQKVCSVLLFPLQLLLHLNSLFRSLGCYLWEVGKNVKHISEIVVFPNMVN